jgi:hypothetical protein
VESKPKSLEWYSQEKAHLRSFIFIYFPKEREGGVREKHESIAASIAPVACGKVGFGLGVNA